jgi:hypothetical protein
LADPHDEPGREVEPPSLNQAQPEEHIRAQDAPGFLERDALKQELPKVLSIVRRHPSSPGKRRIPRSHAAFQTHISQAQTTMSPREEGSHQRLWSADPFFRHHGLANRTFGRTLKGQSLVPLLQRINSAQHRERSSRRGEKRRWRTNRPRSSYELGVEAFETLGVCRSEKAPGLALRDRSTVRTCAMLSP